MSTQTTLRPSGVSVPLSTKLVSTVGVLLVIGGLALGAWNKLSAASQPDSTQVVVGDQGQSLPDLHLLMPGLAVLLVAVFIVSVYVLSRGSKRVR